MAEREQAAAPELATASSASSASAPIAPEAPEDFGPLPNREAYARLFREARLIRRQGKVTQLVGQVIEAYNPGSAVGSLCTIFNPDTNSRVLAEVIGFRDNKMLLMALGQMPD
ncbi:MAG TPA: hypothetical protein VL359_18875, partial [bacterium]|nr:hypothetical protein [bacterium]